MARVNDSDVRGIIPTDPDIDMAPFITMANALTDHVSSCDSDSVLNSNLLIQIERNLAAHFYEHRDSQYESKNTDGASGKFQGKTDMGLNSSKWGQSAMLLDVSGCLRSINKGAAKVGLTWLGKPVSDQIDYTDRD